MVTDASHPQGLKGLDKLNFNFFALCVGVSSSRDAISVQLLLFNVCLKSSFSLSMVRILATCELKCVTDLSEIKQNQEILCLFLGVGFVGFYSWTCFLQVPCLCTQCYQSRNVSFGYISLFLDYTS